MIFIWYGMKGIQIPNLVKIWFNISAEGDRCRWDPNITSEESFSLKSMNASIDFEP